MVAAWVLPLLGRMWLKVACEHSRQPFQAYGLAEIVVGAKVKMKKNHQVGEVKEIRGRRAVVQIGLLPMSVELNDLVVVEEKQVEVK